MRLFGKVRHTYLLILGTLLIALPLVGQADSERVARYPFDPACPWGRISNGKGMIHRCLTKGEAQAIADGSKPALATPANDPKKLPEALPRDFSIQLGSIKADKGDIDAGRLSLPVDRYKDCVVKNGGLKKPEGRIVVQFLVRSDRARAEGVSVDSFEGTTQAAAQCIADVVDRRQVGTPTEAITPVKLTFEIREKK
jgi:hypothetical protein